MSDVTQSPTVPAGDSKAIEETMSAIRSLIREMRMNTRAIESKAGMSLAQLFVLHCLAEKSADSLNELADRTATHQSSVSVVVTRLLQKGYVSRTPSAVDRRRVLLEITPLGRDILTNAPSTIQMRLISSLREMSSEDTAALASLLRRWVSGAGIDTTLAPMLGEDE
jgi:DNA-binding MarR family transcriptional regulator